MIKKLNNLYKWLKADGHSEESFLVSSLIKKAANSSCSPPFDKSTLLGVIASGTIGQGERGPAVGYIQTMLEANGHSLRLHGIDCIFGPETKRALKEFQASKSLEETGEVDDATLTESEKGETAQSFNDIPRFKSN